MPFKSQIVMADILHVSKQRISQMVQEGKLKTNSAGKVWIDATSSDFVAWQNTKHTKRGKPQDALPRPDVQAEAILPVEALANATDFELSKQQKLRVCREKDLEHAEKVGALKKWSDVASVWFERVRTTRDKILSTPSRISAEVASVGGDLVAIEAIMTRALTQALRELTDEAPDVPTG